MPTISLPFLGHMEDHTSHARLKLSSLKSQPEVQPTVQCRSSMSSTEYRYTKDKINP